GWSKYNWKNIFNHPPKPIHVNNRGITLKGRLNISEKKLKGKLTIVSPKNNLYESRKINRIDYKFKHLFLKQNSILVLSYKKKNREIKPKGYLRLIPSLIREKIGIPLNKEIAQIEDTTRININNFLTERELLNEVKLKAKVTFNNKPTFGIGPLKAIKIADHYSDHVNFLDILVSNGFIVDGFAFIDNGNPEILIYERLHFYMWYEYDPRRLVPAKIYLNDMDVSSSTRRLFNLKADHIDEVFINTQESGSFFIYTRKDAGIDDMRINTTNHLVTYGFAIEKEYYTPNYSSYLSNIFKKYGILYWEPKIHLTENANSFQVKVPVHYQNSITIFLEGITNDGKLIYLKKDFKTK
ncbi:MAG: hypothetical protein JKY02_07460, partial [Flavobacteriaceae bacterium]|nr:hypothetical protein [Flavobacteriaceae bacterium]